MAKSASKRMKVSNVQVVLIVGLVALILFMLLRRPVESFSRTALANGACHMVKTPVDFIHGDWQANPHFKAFPPSKYQPLEMGPVDLEHSLTKLAEGRLHEDFDQWWAGPSGGQLHVAQHTKDRSHLTTLGDLTAAWELGDIPTKGHRTTKGMSREEIGAMRHRNQFANADIHMDLLN